MTTSQAIGIIRATKRKMNQDALFDEDGQPLACPACCSEEVKAISDYDRNYALGMFQIYGFIGHLPTVTHVSAACTADTNGKKTDPPQRESIKPVNVFRSAECPGMG